MEKIVVLVNYNSHPIKLFFWIKPKLLGGKIEVNLPVREGPSSQEGILQWEIFLQPEEVKILPLVEKCA